MEKNTAQYSPLHSSVHVSTFTMESSDEHQRRPVARRKKAVVCACVAVIFVVGLGTCFSFLGGKTLTDKGSDEMSDRGSVAAHRMERSTKPNEESLGLHQDEHNQSSTTPSEKSLEERRDELDERLRNMCQKPQDQYIKVDGTSEQYVPVPRCACNTCGHGKTCQPTDAGNTTFKMVIKDEKKSEEEDDIFYKEVDVEAHTECECRT